MIVLKDMFIKCATYIREDSIDLDLKIKYQRRRKERKFILCNNTETACDGKLNFLEIKSKLRKQRVSSYNDWFYIGVVLINLYYRKIVSSYR